MRPGLVRAWRLVGRSLSMPAKVAGWSVPVGWIVSLLYLIAGLASGAGEKVFRFYVPIPGPLMPLELTFVQVLLAVAALLTFFGSLVWNHVAETGKLQEQLAGLTELRPLVAEGTDEDRLYCRLVVANPNPRPVPDCYVKLVDAACIETRYMLRRLPPAGYIFPRSKWAGGGLTFPIPPRGSVEVNIALPDSARIGFLLPAIPGTSYDTAMADGRHLPPGIYQFSVQIGSESAMIEPTIARLRLTHTVEGEGLSSMQFLDMALVEEADAPA